MSLSLQRWTIGPGIRDGPCRRRPECRIVVFIPRKQYDKTGRQVTMDIRITTGLLYQGALAFALMDAVFIPLLIWWVSEDSFRGMKWALVLSAALDWR